MQFVFDTDIAAQITGATTEEGLHMALARAADSIGAPFFAAMVFFDTYHGAANRVIGRMPEGYWSSAGNGGSLIDPVLEHCRTTSIPLFWDRSTYERVEALTQWENIRAAGLAYGVCVALHLAAGRHFVLGFDWPASLADGPPPNEAFRTRARLLVQAYAIHAEPVAFALWSHPDELPEAPARKLTERERQVMVLVARGEVDKAIADHMGVSGPTVRKHIESAMDKLRAVNRTVAAVRTVRLGLTRFGDDLRGKRDDAGSPGDEGDAG